MGGLEDAEDLFAPASSAQVEDTVERPARPSLVEDTVERPARPSLVEDTVERPMRRNQVEDTVERPARRAQVDDTVERPAAHRGAPPVTDDGDTLATRYQQDPYQPSKRRHRQPAASPARHADAQDREGRRQQSCRSRSHGRAADPRFDAQTGHP